MKTPQEFIEEKKINIEAPCLDVIRLMEDYVNNVLDEVSESAKTKTVIDSDGYENWEYEIVDKDSILKFKIKPTKE